MTVYATNGILNHTIYSICRVLISQLQLTLFGYFLHFLIVHTFEQLITKQAYATNGMPLPSLSK